ncbi:hypothetical protein JCM10908_002684 [Rhodotorula pacifica]|uniref:uncharacterized protein n=1 Tax=Rhodotorula pacifica TaxID=1495444 RepID=UPI003176F15F
MTSDLMPDQRNPLHRLLRDIRKAYGFKSEKIESFYELVTLPPKGYRGYGSAPWESVYKELRQVLNKVTAAFEANKELSRAKRRAGSIGAMDAILDQDYPVVKGLIEQALHESPDTGIPSHPRKKQIELLLDAVARAYGSLESSNLVAFRQEVLTMWNNHGREWNSSLHAEIKHILDGLCAGLSSATQTAAAYGLDRQQLEYNLDSLLAAAKTALERVFWRLAAAKQSYAPVPGEGALDLDTNGSAFYGAARPELRSIGHAAHRLLSPRRQAIYARGI